MLVQLEELDRQLMMQNATTTTEQPQVPAIAENQTLSMMRQVLQQQRSRLESAESRPLHVSPAFDMHEAQVTLNGSNGSIIFDKNVTPPHQSTPSLVEVFSPPSAGSVARDWQSLRVTSPLTPVSVSSNAYVCMPCYFCC
jgi:hypothetical protein